MVYVRAIKVHVKVSVFSAVLERPTEFNLVRWLPRPSFINRVKGALLMPSLTQTEQIEKELFPLEKHQGDYFCSLKLLERGLGQRKGGGWGWVELWAADCFTCQICNAFLWAGSWLNSRPWRSGRGSPKPGEFQTSCFGVPLANTGAVARHLQTGSHLPID